MQKVDLTTYWFGSYIAVMNVAIIVDSFIFTIGLRITSKVTKHLLSNDLKQAYNSCLLVIAQVLVISAICCTTIYWFKDKITLTFLGVASKEGLRTMVRLLGVYSYILPFQILNGVLLAINRSINN